MKIAFLFLTIVGFIVSSHAAPIESCNLKAFNIIYDLDSKDPKAGAVKKIYVFEPTQLATDSMFAGLVLNDDSPFAKANASIQYKALDSNNKEIVLQSKTDLLEKWEEKEKFLKLKHFNPEKVLSHFHSNQPNKQLRKIVVSLKGPGKAECEQVLMVGDGE